MRITWTELVVELGSALSDDLLTEWQWLIPPHMNLFMVSSLGDAFLEDENGSVHWLDTGAAKMVRVASSTEQFDELRQAPEHAANWFLPQLVGDLLQGGISLGANQVFSCKLPPTLNGRYEPDNFEPTDVSVHFAVLGSIQRQIQSLPKGTVISKFVAEM